MESTMVNTVLIFSIILIAVVILVLLVLLIFITVRLTKRLSELSKSFTDFISTFSKKSGELLEQATAIMKTAENTLTDEKEVKTQKLLRDIFRGAVFAFEIISMFKKLKKEESKSGEGKK